VTQVLLPKHVLGNSSVTTPEPPDPCAAGWYTDPLSGVWLRHWSGARWLDDLPPAPPPRSVRPVAAARKVEGVPAILARMTEIQIAETWRLVLAIVAATLTGVLVTAVGIMLSA